jgi:hypothetical protein
MSSSENHQAPPQLGRKCYSVDNTSSDDDDINGLEILSPAKKNPLTARSIDIQQTMKPQPETKKPSAKRTILFGLDDSDSDDDLLLYGKAMLARKTTMASKPKNQAAAAAAVTKAAVAPPTVRDEARLQKKHETEVRKQHEQRLKAQAREEVKLVRERKKEEEKQEKLQKAQQRQDQKLVREQQKEQEKQGKKRQREQEDQGSGKFAKQEMVVLMDPDVHKKEEYAPMVEALKEDFLIHSYPSSLPCQKAIQWVRKDHLQGGAKEALTHLEAGESNHFEHLHHVILLLEPEDFIPLVR